MAHTAIGAKNQYFAPLLIFLWMYLVTSEFLSLEDQSKLELTYHDYPLIPVRLINENIWKAIQAYDEKLKTVRKTGYSKNNK